MSLQVELFLQLQKSGVLSEEEQDIVRWALNAKWSKPLRALTMGKYKQASALEALVRGHVQFVCIPYRVLWLLGQHL